MILSDSDIVGRTVIAADGQAVGEISAVCFDSVAWRVELLRIKLRKEAADQLGVSHGMFQAGTLEVPVHLIQSVGDAVILSIPTLELRQTVPRAENLPAERS
jgi:sporulation protein YlmC with PRC-barrel domain